MCVNSEGSGETARMRRLTWTFDGRLCDKYHNLMNFYMQHFWYIQEMMTAIQGTGITLLYKQNNMTVNFVTKVNEMVRSTCKSFL